MEILTWYLAEAVAVAAAGIFTVRGFKVRQQRRADHMRKSFELIFPPTMNPAQVLAFTRSLSGLPHPKLFGAVHAPVFEVHADVDGFRYFLHIPGHVDASVDIWLKDHIPGVNLVPLESDPVAATRWTGTQITLRGHDTQLHIEDVVNASVDMRSNFKKLREGESAVMQWLIWPARHEVVTPENKTKLSDKTFNVSLRMGAAGEYPERILQDLYMGLRRASKTGANFRRRPVLNVGNKISRRSGDFTYAIVLNALEISALMGWPLTGGKLDKLPPDPMIPTEGIVLAASNYPGMAGRPLALSIKAMTRHEWIIGPTGSGKSALLHNKAIQLARAGLGFCVIEPKGDLCRDILNSIPENRINDVIYFDPTDEEWPIGLNMLAGDDPHQVAQYIVSLFKSRFPDSWGPRLQMFLRVGAYTAAVSGLSIYELKELMRNPSFSRPYVRKLKDKSIQRDWEDIWKSGELAVHSITNKVDQFTSNPMIRNIVGQTSGLNMRDVILGNKILLVPMTIEVGALNAGILSDVVFGQMWRAARTIPEVARRPFGFIGDEFQEIVKSVDGINDVLAMARSYQFCFTGAHQFMAQLTEPGMNKAILPAMKNNASTKLSYAPRAGDSANLEPYFGPMTAKDLEAMPEYGVAISMMTDKGLAPTVTGMTYPPPEPTGFGDMARRASRSQWARPKAEVEAEIDSRYPDESAERRRPVIGRLDDDDTP